VRIGVVTTSYPRTPGEPAGAFVAEHCEWIGRQGHQVEVVAAGGADVDDTWQESPITRVLAAPGLFYEGGAPDALQSKLNQWHALRFQGRLAREIQKRAKNWDGIVAHWLAPCALAALVASNKKPIWAIAHGGDVYLLERLKLTSAVARLLDRPNLHLNFVSESVREVFARNAGRSGSKVVARSTVVSMGIDLDHFRSVRAHNESNRKPVVLFLGRLVPIKGVDTFIESLQGLERDCEVIVAGAGPLEASLKERAGRAGLHIRWAGEVRDAQRDGLLRAADVVVVPSRAYEGRQEGMPVVALEALACGAQLLCSRSGGLGEIPAEICHHVESENPRALRATLRDIIDGRRAKRGPESWLAGRSWESVAPRLLPGLNQAQKSWRGA
jgi:glycosyltransferase involved in cell wall biosynthesis